MSNYNSEITQLGVGQVLRYTMRCDGEPLSWSDVIDGWQNDHSFRRFFVATLINAPFPAYFWETPPVTDDTREHAFEFVLVDSPQLFGVRTDRLAFDDHFAAAEPGKTVIEFSNLGGDATLVVPTPCGSLPAYAHIGAFARAASDQQQHDLWSLVGATLEQQLCSQPVWINTSGLGIYWLHIRLDSTPKYYTHKPYR